jgi:serine/threonine-protein kinase
MDFGLAKMLQADPSGRKASDTGMDFAVGTPGYISPEQVRGDQIDHRSDLYSVGVILFELLTGRLPFTGDETMDVLLAHATEPPPSFASLGASSWVPLAIETVVQSCLAKNPADRPASARELAERYEAAVMGEIAELAEEAEEVSADQTPASEPTPLPPFDPQVVIHRMEAWMPESIATYKLRGFVHDFQGEVLESVPGMIRVRLGNRSWFGMGRKGVIDLELVMERNNLAQQNLLNITVKMRSPDERAVASTAWRSRCTQIFCDLRAYLVGASVNS